MNNQLWTRFEKILSKFHCGFRKGFSTQHCLLLMTENWKHAADNSKGNKEQTENKERYHL